MIQDNIKEIQNIIKAKASDCYWSKAKLFSFSIDYNSKNNVAIDINSLIDRHWIRKVHWCNQNA
jgi:hypothetical protein